MSGGLCTKCGYSLEGLKDGAVCPECATPVTEAPRGPQAGQHCIRCGYSLAGLSAEGVCPECGTAVADSLRGPLLKYSSPEYLVWLHRGVFVIVTVVLVQVLLMILGFGFGMTAGGFIGTMRGPAPQLAFAAMLLNTGLEFALLWGWWMFTAPDPALAEAERGTTARKVVRLAVGLTAASAVIGLLLEFATFRAVGLRVVIGVLSIILTAVKFFAGMRYVQWLGPRIPSMEVQKKARKYVWLLPLLVTVGSLACGLGPLVATVLNWNLLDQIRKHLKQIRGEQALAVAVH
jgi:hypothetical protein